MKPAPRIAFLILFLATSQSLLAREPVTRLPEYEIELIVFARDAFDADGNENWPRMTDRPDWSPASKARMESLPPDRHRLSKEFQRLKNTRGRLRPLVHRAWRQSVQNKRRSSPVYIHSAESRGERGGLAGESPPELEGTVLVSSNRYLHVDLDLVLSGLTPPDPTPSSEPGDPDGDLFAARYRSYRMRDHRRMRSGELHYIDHPLFGVLMLATPSAHPEPEAVVAPTQESPAAPNTGPEIEGVQPKTDPKTTTPGPMPSES